MQPVREEVYGPPELRGSHEQARWHRAVRMQQLPEMFYVQTNSNDTPETLRLVSITDDSRIDSNQ